MMNRGTREVAGPVIAILGPQRAATAALRILPADLAAIV